MILFTAEAVKTILNCKVYFLINHIEDMTPTVLTAAIATVLLCKSNEEQSPYYASFWVESLPMVWLLSILIWKWI